MAGKQSFGYIGVHALLSDKCVKSNGLLGFVLDITWISLSPVFISRMKHRLLTDPTLNITK